MNKQALLIILAMFFAHESGAQIFDYFHPNFSADGPVFRADFISANKIRSLSVTYQRKRDGRPMEPIADKDEIHFDKEGNEYERVQIRQNRIKTDSIHWIRIFHSGKVIRETKIDALGEYLSEWIYNPEGKVSERTFTRNNFLISKETAQWSGNQCTWKNSDNKPYLKEEFEYDEYGRLLRKKELLIITQKSRVSTYSYDEIGRISQIIETSIENKTVSYNFNYSRPGELLSLTIKSEDKNEELEILYEKGLPTAFIQRNIETNTMRIGKFEFQFYP